MLGFNHAECALSLGSLTFGQSMDRAINRVKDFEYGNNPGHLEDFHHLGLWPDHEDKLTAPIRRFCVCNYQASDSAGVEATALEQIDNDFFDAFR